MGKIDKKDMKTIQLTVGFAEDVIRNIVTANGVEPYDLGRNGYKTLETVFYAMNTLWLEIHRELTEGGED